jgi:hypothetical protein
MDGHCSVFSMGTNVSRLLPFQPHIQRISEGGGGVIFPEARQPKREIYYEPPTSAEVKNA